MQLPTFEGIIVDSTLRESSMYSIIRYQYVGKRILILVYSVVTLRMLDCWTGRQTKAQRSLRYQPDVFLDTVDVSMWNILK
jgi:hypothetical protein